jgi:hypothetical protein
MLKPGRRFWFFNRVPGLEEYVVGPMIVVGFKQFCPAGPIIDKVTGEDTGRVRKQGLVQLYTDPGGMRTLAVADIRLHDPRRR